MTASGPEPERDADDPAGAADADAAAAHARAEAARERAEELRNQLPPQLRKPARTIPWRAVAAGAAAALSAGLIALSALMFWSHRGVSQQRQQEAEFAAAARQSVVNLMSIDYTTAKDSVQRVLDGSTGKFRANFEESAADFVKALQDEQITTTASVNDVAVESVTGDSAVVLVSATSRREGAKAPKDQQQPRVWRMVLTLERDGGVIKMSGVEFV